MPDRFEPPAPSRWWCNFFSRYCRTYLRRHFHAVRLARANWPGVDSHAEMPTVIYLNHPSWWDPLACVLLASTFFPTRQHYAVMDAAMLRRYGIFSRLGFFGIEKGPRGAMRFLRAGQAVLGRPGAVLWITAQGRFADVRQRPARLAVGLAHLLRRSGQPAVMVRPLAVELAFWEERTAEMLLRFGTPLCMPRAERTSLAAVTQRLEAHLTQAQDALAADSIARNVESFEVLLSGRSGIGGIYDWWRRGRAMLGGERFRQQHGER